jgi:hypothetical protein
MRHEIQKELSDYFDINGYMLEANLVMAIREFRVQSR